MASSPERLAAALALLSSGAWQQAEAAACAAVADDPGDLHAALILGLAIAGPGEAARAAPILARIADMRPDLDHPCLDLARMEPRLPRALVTGQFRACLRLPQADDRLRLTFAEDLLDTDQAPEAEEILQDLSASVTSQFLLGFAHAEQNRFATAVECFRRATALEPGTPSCWSNLGNMLAIETRFSEAIPAHDQAVALAPNYPQFRVNRAVALLRAGLWERAWRDYEARLELADLPRTIIRDCLMPALGPGDSLVGLTILALHEEGFGDTLQFLRYLPLLAERGARVVAYVPPALERVMRLVPGVLDVVTDLRALPAFDFVCPMFSLPKVFATTVETVPPVPAISLDADLVRFWTPRLPGGMLRVGLVWAGQARPQLPGFTTLDRRRSAGLAAFAPLFEVPGVEIVSLQFGPRSREQDEAPFPMADPMGDVRDFADTAAIIAGLDVVVSVDTSVVHLAGLVGKPVFLLDRYDSCWRWLSGRSDSPWYPHLTIFRQEQAGDWSVPMARVAASLRTMARFGGGGSSSQLRLPQHPRLLAGAR
jgi:tetratricopeptide (TPR) repeat protein